MAETLLLASLESMVGPLAWLAVCGPATDILASTPRGLCQGKAGLCPLNSEGGEDPLSPIFPGHFRWPELIYVITRCWYLRQFTSSPVTQEKNRGITLTC